MRKVILVLLLVCAGILHAQQLEVTEFRVVPNMDDAVRNPKVDFNGDRCGLVKLGLNMSEIAFEGDIISADYRNDQWWIYMIKDSNWLTIKSKNNVFVPLRCEFDDFKIAGIESDMTYEMNVELPPPPKVEDKNQNLADSNGGSNSLTGVPQQSTTGRSSYSPYSYGHMTPYSTTSRTSSSSSSTYNSSYKNNTHTSSNSSRVSTSNSFSGSHASSSSSRVGGSQSSFSGNYKSSRSSLSSGSNRGSRSSSSSTFKASGSSNNNSSGRSQSVSPKRSSGSTSSRGSSTVSRSSSSSSRSSSRSSRSSNASTSRGSSSSRGSK